MPNIINELKNLEVTGPTLDELIVLSAQARAIAAEYEQAKVGVPIWLNDARAQLSVEIVNRGRDNLRKQIREAEFALDRLKTPTEKRAETEAQLAELKARLATA